MQNENDSPAHATPDPAGMFVVEDWTWSTVPPPLLGVGPTEAGDAYVVVGMEDGRDEIRAARRLTPAQAFRLAAELRARALVLEPSLADPTMCSEHQVPDANGEPIATPRLGCRACSAWMTS